MRREKSCSGFFELQNTYYYPGEIISQLYLMMGTHLLIGTQEFLDLIRFMVEDIQTYPKFEGKRILWIHLLPFYQETLKKYFNGSKEYQITAGDIVIDYMEKMDPEKPFESLAKKDHPESVQWLLFTEGRYGRRAGGPAETGRSHPFLPLGMQAGIRRKSDLERPDERKRHPDADSGR